MKHFMITAIIAVAALLAAGGETMKDVPVPSNQSIIIFSATGGGTNEGGRVRQNISFTALTAVTVTGGLENDWVRITPSGNSFTAVAKFHKASGSATFTATVTTAGDAEKNLEGMTVSFSFRVLVLGVDFPHLTQSFYEFPVGAKVAVTLPVFFAAQQAQLNIAKVPTAITSQTYGTTEIYTDTEHGDIHRTRWVGEPSGISIDPTLDELNYVRGASLSGVALRPGIYYYAFEISSYDDGGGSDPFPGANGYGIVIINVYDDRESPRISLPYDYVPNNADLRVIRHAIEGYTASRLTGPFVKSGDVWTRTVSEPVSEGVNDVWEYRMERNTETGVWYLYGRNHLSDETAPEYSTLASATKTYSGPIPPNTGWTGGVLAVGPTNYCDTGFGSFDYKGERQVEIAGEDPYVSAIYEQQPIVAAQYPGWSNPPATRNADGLYLAKSPDGKWRVSADPVAIDGTEVKVKTIQHLFLPLHPPTAAPAIGGVHYRDVVGLIKDAAGSRIFVNANLPKGGNLSLLLGKYLAGVPAHYTFLRQLPPPVSNETARAESITYSVTSDQRSNTYGRSREYTNYGTTSFTAYGKTDEESRTEKTFSGTASLDAWLRSGELVSGVMAAYPVTAPGSLDYHYNYDYLMETWNTSDVSGTLAGQKKKNTATLKELTGGRGRFIIVPATGRNETDNRVRAYVSGFLDAAASFSTDITRLEQNRFPGEDWITTRDETAVGSDGASCVALSPAPTAVELSSFAISGLTTETASHSFSGRHDVQRYGMYMGAPGSTEQHLVDIALTHTRTKYSGDNLPPGLIGYGITHHVRTTTVPGSTPVVVDEWLNDPTGSVYEALKTEFLNVDEVNDPGPWPSEEEGGGINYHFDVFITSSETYSQTTQTFGS